ncbi:MAG: sugar ABC transporter permease [Ignavibacteria bacterium CG_4_8_14_3_um_filter_37_9]|nr:sugar ABC transporter permease [Ignavibacteria bacterium]OIO17494.1 MAG: sugar ABC transporter permease [Ignavibacteria bacterium CG1_02_37_35]PIP79054.1 MAG: sugar ABC transporter permease [Ignavibacteria bacterium CG22_combo_CG10-13_8_21_14_all_37_15]PIX00368.1 MAG: sugar ABC transporter permease [Ignavibacteria bacterium CG_4_8_14_3_um_filter_37_9]PIX92989.1 MAG: sugar ABC transporter permease [Ignavibacteria bacterium CG_4_10_14_3_um_filter_37_18]PJC59836.1 MAG: sugar ABC transporter pe
MINRKKILPYLLVSPYIVHFLLFVAFPVVFSIVLTFHKWNIISPMEYTGFNNYIRLFNDKTFFKAIGNTLIFLIIHIPLQIIVALFLAEILNQKIKLRGVFRGAFFLPVIVSGVVVTILWQQLFGFDTGLFNRLLTGIGFGKIGWLTDPNIAMTSIAVMATWKNVGLYIILFLVGLQTVPTQYYEAADLEGANHWQKFFKITLPMINPTIFMVVILSTIGGFSLFIEPYIMTGGGPLNSTVSAVLYIYKQGFFYYHMGYAATLGLFFAFIILAVVMIQKKFIEKDH